MSVDLDDYREALIKTAPVLADNYREPIPFGYHE